MRAVVMGVLIMSACNGEKEGATGETGTDTGTVPVTNSTGDVRVATILALTGDAAAAAGNYSAVCAACHGADGTGVAPNPALTERVPAISDEQVVTVILEGLGNMDAYKSTFNNQEIADLLVYVRTTFGS